MNDHEIQRLKRQIRNHEREIARQYRMIQQGQLKIENENRLKDQAEEWLKETENETE